MNICELAIVEVMSMRVSSRRSHLSSESGIVKWSLSGMIDTGIIDESVDLGIVQNVCRMSELELVEVSNLQSLQSRVKLLSSEEGGVRCPYNPPRAIACINICAHVKIPKHWQPYFAIVWTKENTAHTHRNG